MPRLVKKSAQKIGLPPGTLVHIGEKKAESMRISVIDYNEQNYTEKTVTSAEELAPFKADSTVTWINVDGLHEVSAIEQIGNQFELNPLTMEDIVHTGQRPKVEDRETYIYLVLKMIRFNEKRNRINLEQVSLILGDNVVLTFQECVGDVFDAVRDRIKTNKGRIRKVKADYLLYSLVDSIVDHYFLVLEKIGERIEKLQEQVTADPTEQLLHEIHILKRELLYLRKSVWPLREVVNNLQKSESPLIEEKTEIFLKDVYDHIFQVIDTTETYREMISGMLDIYLSSISNRMNAVMKVLTIIATIFIPLTFLAGIYGMNFKYMPELDWRWSYPIVWIVMIAIAIVMLQYFRRKKWL